MSIITQTHLANNAAGQMSFLKSKRKRFGKRITPTGSKAVGSGGKGPRLELIQETVESIFDVAKVLEQHASAGNIAVTWSKAKSGRITGSAVSHGGADFELGEQPFAGFDFDKVSQAIGDQFGWNVVEIGKYLRSLMPPEFHDVRMLIQATSSYAVFSGKSEPKPNLRLWVYFSRPITAEEAKALVAGLKGSTAECDPSMVHTGQLIFIADPWFADGAENPFANGAKRWNWIDGNKDYVEMPQLSNSGPIVSPLSLLPVTMGADTQKSLLPPVPPIGDSTNGISGLILPPPSNGDVVLVEVDVKPNTGPGLSTGGPADEWLQGHITNLDQQQLTALTDFLGPKFAARQLQREGNSDFHTWVQYGQALALDLLGRGQSSDDVWHHWFKSWDGGDKDELEKQWHDLVRRTNDLISNNSEARNRGGVVTLKAFIALAAEAGFKLPPAARSIEEIFGDAAQNANKKTNQRLSEIHKLRHEGDFTGAQALETGHIEFEAIRASVNQIEPKLACLRNSGNFDAINAIAQEVGTHPMIFRRADGLVSIKPLGALAGKAEFYPLEDKKMRTLVNDLVNDLVQVVEVRTVKNSRIMTPEDNGKVEFKTSDGSIRTGWLLDAKSLSARWLAGAEPSRTNKSNTMTSIGVIKGKVPRAIIDSVILALSPQTARKIHGVAFAPLLREDGSIAQIPGYDPITKWWCSPHIKIEEHPAETLTRKHCWQALQTLRGVFEGTQFLPLDPEAKGVNVEYWKVVSELTLVTMVISLACRGNAYDGFPIHVASAAGSGNGKSFTQTVAALAGSGQQVEAINLDAKGSDKDIKQDFGLAILKGAPLLLDNLAEMPYSRFLLSAITQGTVSARMPYGEGLVEINTEGVGIFANGIDLEITDEFVRRCVLTKLGRYEHGGDESRTKKKILSSIRRNRTATVQACFDLVRGWMFASANNSSAPSVSVVETKATVTPMRDFEEWSNIVCRAVFWASGATGPIGGRSGVNIADGQKWLWDNDPKADADIELLEAIIAVHDEQSWYARELVNYSGGNDHSKALKEMIHRRWREGDVSRGFGNWLSRTAGKELANCTVAPIATHGNSKKSKQWRVMWTGSDADRPIAPGRATLVKFVTPVL